MKILLDTQMVIWATFWPELLPGQARQLIADEDNDMYFSPASLWEVAIKSAQNRPDFQVDAKILRGQLLERGYREMAITGLHTTAVSDLPLVHKDPFDRLLLAQAKTENLSLVTSDATLAMYPAPVLLIRRC
ncbi:MAG: type II toxin-antitoxin system VapC family toxin [Candidatus Adiutrix sp.]|jgi:PIN domain nuclease of toxin-antitoxin system|nr:type II toxin-antitoxin system VapC family toxin [Candidatus Adiutrix sp.]